MARIREILLLHHSHLDVGYTHSQPVVMELQREFIDQALRLLEETSGWPEESRPAWTCEVTEPLLRWMDEASPADVERLRGFIREGRLGVSAMRYNTTALCSAELLSRQLAPSRALRSSLGAALSTVIQHDINGVPWPFSDLMIDAGIELLVMGVNIDHGHFVPPRPGVFSWETPSGRKLLVMNGCAYTMFDQVFRTWNSSVPAMQQGFTEYVAHLEAIGYPYDFLYLTTTNPPQAWDNSPPNPWVVKLVRQWNEEGREPQIRYVTPEGLLSRLRQIPEPGIPVLRGDWTDYWSFGAGSTAYETGAWRDARFLLEEADLLRAPLSAGRSAASRRIHGRAWEALSLFAEHTWTSWDPAPTHPPARAQSTLKAAVAHEARELASYLLVDEMERLAGNAAQSLQPDHVLIVNPHSRARSAAIRVPHAWLRPGKHLRVQRFAADVLRASGAHGAVFGPIDLPAFGWRRMPVADLPRLQADNRLVSEAAGKGAGAIESPFHRLTYDTSTGRVTGVRDKRTGWDAVPPLSAFAFFEPVAERPDPRVDDSRAAMYERDLEKEKVDRHCWKTDWKAERQGTVRVLSCRVSLDEDSVSLHRDLAVAGFDVIRQKITLRADSEAIELEAVLHKQERVEPEALYFAFPLSLEAGWRCHFDTAGVPVELDAEQLPGSCRGWVSVDTMAALHGGSCTAALICREATLVQPGGFFFGRLLPDVSRPGNPVLLSWPLNNYWNTNFPFTQPGVIRLRYAFLTSGDFDAADVMERARAFIHPPIVHPASRDGTEEGRFLSVTGRHVMVNHVKPAEDGRGIVVRLVNAGAEQALAQVRLGNAPVRSAWVCGTFEDDRERLAVVDGTAQVALAPRRLTLVRICRD